MVALKFLLAALPSIFQITSALPTADVPVIGLTARQDQCFPPTNCGASIGDCEYCCTVTPNSSICHVHTTVRCGANNLGQRYHCDDH